MSQVKRRRVLDTASDLNLASAIDIKYVGFEPRTDLVAVIETGGVDVYRLAGQRATRIDVDTLSGQPKCLRWTQQGDVLLIGTDTGIVDAIYMKSSRSLPARKHRVIPKPLSPVAAIGPHSINVDGTTRSAPGRSSRDRSLQNDKGQASITAWLDNLSLGPQKRHARGQPATMPLPHHLAYINTSDVLPRLSVIPPPARAGPGMPVPILKSVHPENELVLIKGTKTTGTEIEVTFVTHADGTVVGTVADLLKHKFASETAASSSNLHLDCHNSSASTHAVLQADLSSQDGSKGQKEQQVSRLLLRLFQLPFLTSGTIHTTTILQNATNLHRLRLYLNQTIDTITTNWTTLMTLPKRLMSGVSEVLEEKQEGTLRQQFYQLLLAGYCSPAVTEWLKDELTERGHKRWDHSLTTFHQSTMHLLEINLLPALERLTISASTLRGLATYFDGSAHFSVPPHLYTNVLDAVQPMQLLVHTALLLLGREERAFRAFSTWLRCQIDLAATEPGSQAVIDTAERAAMTVDVPGVLEYLDGPFAESGLVPVLGRNMDQAELERLLSTLDLSSEELAKSIKASAAVISSSEAPDDRLHLPLHMLRLQRAIEACSAQMQRWQSETWLPPQRVEISVRDLAPDLHISLTADNAMEDEYTVVGKDTAVPSRIHVYTVTTRTTGGGRSRSNTFTAASSSSTLIDLPDFTQAEDVKLLADGYVLGLVNIQRAGQNEQSTLVQLPRSLFHGQDGLLPGPIAVTESTLNDTIIHEFDAADKFEPGHLVLGDDLHVTRRSVLVLDKSRRRWKVLRLPDRSPKERQDFLDDGEDQHNPFGLESDLESMLVD